MGAGLSADQSAGGEGEKMAESEHRECALLEQSPPSVTRPSWMESPARDRRVGEFLRFGSCRFLGLLGGTLESSFLWIETARASAHHIEVAQLGSSLGNLLHQLGDDVRVLVRDVGRLAGVSIEIEELRFLDLFDQAAPPSGSRWVGGSGEGPASMGQRAPPVRRQPE